MTGDCEYNHGCHSPVKFGSCFKYLDDKGQYVKVTSFDKQPNQTLTCKRGPNTGE